MAQYRTHPSKSFTADRWKSANTDRRRSRELGSPIGNSLVEYPTVAKRHRWSRVSKSRLRPAIGLSLRSLPRWGLVITAFQAALEAGDLNGTEYSRRLRIERAEGYRLFAERAEAAAKNSVKDDR